MQKNLFNTGDVVIFAQHYLHTEPNYDLYEKVGTICEGGTGITEMVRFSHDLQIREVNSEDLEFFFENPDDHRPHPESADVDLDQFGGMSKTQMIVHKLFAQENDPALDYHLTAALFA